MRITHYAVTWIPSVEAPRVTPMDALVIARAVPEASEASSTIALRDGVLPKDSEPTTAELVALHVRVVLSEGDQVVLYSTTPDGEHVKRGAYKQVRYDGAHVFACYLAPNEELIICARGASGPYRAHLIRLEDAIAPVYVVPRADDPLIKLHERL